MRGFFDPYLFLRWSQVVTCALPVFAHRSCTSGLSDPDAYCSSVGVVVLEHSCPMRLPPGFAPVWPPCREAGIDGGTDPACLARCALTYSASAWRTRAKVCARRRSAVTMATSSSDTRWRAPPRRCFPRRRCARVTCSTVSLAKHLVQRAACHLRVGSGGLRMPALVGVGCVWC